MVGFGSDVRLMLINDHGGEHAKKMQRNLQRTIRLTDDNRLDGASDKTSGFFVHCWSNTSIFSGVIKLMLVSKTMH